MEDFSFIDFSKCLKFMIVQFEWYLHVYFMVVLCGLIFQINLCTCIHLFKNRNCFKTWHCELLFLTKVILFPEKPSSHGFSCKRWKKVTSALFLIHVFMYWAVALWFTPVQTCRSGFSHIEINAAVFISVRLCSNKHTCNPLWAWTRKTLVDLILKLCVQINTLALREVLLYLVFMSWPCVL